MKNVLQARYRILRPLGRGGRGSVFLCDDLRLPGRQWALKRLQGGEAEDPEQFRALFRREAATLSSLRHPNLPLVVDSFEEGSDLYLVMEYVDGENLAEFVHKHGPLEELAAFEVGLVLAELLDFLHQHEPAIIFRDLKPDNCMRTEGGQIKLIDFGLARRFVVGKLSDTMPAGSVGYASPEQWDEQSQTDERSDIYGWGATLLHLLTGKIPPPQFPLAVLKSSARPVSEAAHEILRACLMPRPVDRLQSARLLRQMVGYYLVIARQGGAVLGTAPGRPGFSSSSAEEASLSSAGASSPLFGGAAEPVLLPSSGLASDSVVSPHSRLLPSIPVDNPSKQGKTPSWRLTLLAMSLVVAVVGLLWWHGHRVPGSPGEAPPSPQSIGVVPFRHREESNPLRAAALKAYQEGRWAEAIDLLDQTLTKYPEDAEAHVLLENSYVRLEGRPYLRLPCICTLSGFDGPESYSHLYGIALAQSTINARGGIAGRHLVVDYQDDASSTARCLQIAEQFIADSSNLLVLGPSTSQHTLALAPLFNHAALSLVAPTASASKVWEAGPYIFSAADAREPRVRYLARYVTRQSHPRIVVFHTSTVRLSVEMKDVFIDEAGKRGATCLEGPAFPQDASKVDEQVKFVLQQQPDVVFIADYRGLPIARLCVALRQAGVRALMCSQVVPYTPALVDVGGSSVDGMLTTEYFHPELNTSNMRAFVAAFRRKFGDVTSTYAAANNFDAIMLIAKALETCKTRQQVRDYLSSTGKTRPDADGVGGHFALGRRMDARPVHLILVQNGRFVLLDGPASPSGGAAKTSP